MNALHYPDLERCKKLTELGFPDTEAEWHLLIEENDMVISRMTSTMNELFITSDKIPTGNYVCPSVMEMMDVIIEKNIRVDSMQAKGWLSSGDYIRVSAFIKYRELDGKGIVADTYPNALADLTIWLIENGHLTFDKR